MPLLPRTRSRVRQIGRVLPALFWHLASGRPGRLSTLADTLAAEMIPPPQVLGVENIPAEGPFILVFNHYEDARAPAWWGPLLISRVVAACRQAEPREMRWIMAREWWYPGGFGRAVKQPLTRLLFDRVSRAYGMVLVPPVLAGDLTHGEGVEGVRHALALTHGPHPALIGIAPEGHTGPGGTLKETPSGTGLFLRLLSHGAIPFVPVGWWVETDGTVIIRFGASFLLSDSRVERRERDSQTAAEVMTAIGRLLPQRLRGVYPESPGRA